MKKGKTVLNRAAIAILVFLAIFAAVFGDWRTFFAGLKENGTALAVQILAAAGCYIAAKILSKRT